LLGYWRHLLTLLVLGLVAVLGYGQWSSYHQRAQRAATAEIADALAGLPAPLPALSDAIASGQPVDLAQAEQIGDKIVTIANASNGTARVEGLLTAAELFRVADKTDKQRDALKGASEHGSGMLAYAAESGLANLELEN